MNPYVVLVVYYRGPKKKQEWTRVGCPQRASRPGLERGVRALRGRGVYGETEGRGAGESPPPTPNTFSSHEMGGPVSIFEAILGALVGALGFFLFRQQGKALSTATARADALAEALRVRRRAEQEHAAVTEVIDDVEARNADLDLDGLANAVESVFGDMQNNAD